MIKRGKIKQKTAVLTVICMLAAGIPMSPVLAADTEAIQALYTKNENVYAKLEADGSLAGIYVVNVFEVKQAGDVTDYGAYEEAVNLTGQEELSCEDGRMQFEAPVGKFYYQGTGMQGELPWTVDITYRLDGEELTPGGLGGKTGALDIAVEIGRNKGADQVFYDNYLMQISLTLDSEICTRIRTEKGTVADAGAGQTITFTVMPGKEASFLIQADVVDFAMPGFTFAAVPYSMDMDDMDVDTDEMTAGITELCDAILVLNEGTTELKEGIIALGSGAGALREGAGQLESGLHTLKESSAALTAGSSGIQEALNTISGQLSAADFSSMNDLKQLPEALMQLSGALSQVNGGLTELSAGFAQAYAALAGVMEQSKGILLSEQELYLLQAALTDPARSPEELAMLQKLAESYQNQLMIQGTFDAVKPAFDGVVFALDTSSESSVITAVNQVSDGINKMTQELTNSLGDVDITSSMEQLKAGMALLADQYGQFHDGLYGYVNAVGQISDGYKEFSTGLNTYLDGVGQAADGTGLLAGGMQEFSDQTRNMPDEMQGTIDEMMEQYGSKEFDAVSFVDQRNDTVEAVQFVFSTAGIKKQEAAVPEEPETTESFWDRLFALFQ